MVIRDLMIGQAVTDEAAFRVRAAPDLKIRGSRPFMFDFKIARHDINTLC